MYIVITGVCFIHTTLAGLTDGRTLSLFQTFMKKGSTALQYSCLVERDTSLFMLKFLTQHITSACRLFTATEIWYNLRI